MAQLFPPQSPDQVGTVRPRKRRRSLDAMSAQLGSPADKKKYQRGFDVGVWLDAGGACKRGAGAETTSRKTLAFAKSRASPARLAHSGLAVGLPGMTLHPHMSASA